MSDMSLLRIQIIKDLITVEAKEKRNKTKEVSTNAYQVQWTILQWINYATEKRPMIWLNGWDNGELNGYNNTTLIWLPIKLNIYKSHLKCITKCALQSLTQCYLIVWFNILLHHGFKILTHTHIFVHNPCFVLNKSPIALLAQCKQTTVQTVN